MTSDRSFAAALLATVNLAASSAAGPSTGQASDPQDQLIVALDFPSADSALAMADRLAGTCRWVKVGLELYCAAGISIVGKLRERGFEVFLDLKLHDIPNTVAGGVRSVASCGASLLTIHAAGGEAMMRAAAEAASAPGSPRLLAVTVLTSMAASDLTSIGVTDSPATQVLRLANLAHHAGIPGIVCSADEVAVVRATLGPLTTIVLPGIRPAGADLADQRRVATPGAAIAWGASMLVVGRPITGAADPASAANAILEEIAAAQPHP